MSRKLAQKAGLVKVPPAIKSTSGIDPSPPPSMNSSALDLRPKTAPGAMAAFLGTQSTAVREAEELRRKLDALDGALPARRIDPRLIRPSAWANRSEASFETEDFAALKLEIASAGGNVQPVKVRRVPGAKEEYELVYGHRRHRACLQLGLPVLALVDEIDDATLFVEMDRENRHRKDLSAWEQGVMYARALERGLFSSNRRLAQAVGRDLGDVGKALNLAALPKEVVDAFATPLDLQFRFAAPLTRALAQDPEGLLARARSIAQLFPRPKAKEVLALLLDVRQEEDPLRQQVLTLNGATVATITHRSGGQLAITIHLPMTHDEADRVVAALQRELSTIPQGASLDGPTPV